MIGTVLPLDPSFARPKASSSDTVGSLADVISLTASETCANSGSRGALERSSGNSLVRSLMFFDRSAALWFGALNADDG
jgi:hypothetical protein